MGRVGGKDSRRWGRNGQTARRTRPLDARRTRPLDARRATGLIGGLRGRGDSPTRRLVDATARPRRHRTVRDPSARPDLDHVTQPLLRRARPIRDRWQLLARATSSLLPPLHSFGAHGPSFDPLRARCTPSAPTVLRSDSSGRQSGIRVKLPDRRLGRGRVSGTWSYVPLTHTTHAAHITSTSRRSRPTPSSPHTESTPPPNALPYISNIFGGRRT